VQVAVGVTSERLLVTPAPTRAVAASATAATMAIRVFMVLLLAFVPIIGVC